MAEKPKTLEIPVIPEISFPGMEDGGVATSGKKSSTSYEPPAIPQISFPRQIIASQVISASLNTQSRRILGGFSFAKSGALRIGNYVNGVSGDISLSPNGIVARNSSGAATITVDGTTGSVTILGTLAAGSVVTGYLQVGSAAGDVNSGSTTISGGKITTGSITSTQIAAGTITADQIAANTITGAKIAGGTVNASNIAALAIRTSHIDAEAVGASEIKANAITAVKIAAGVITADKIASNTITGAQITTGVLETTAQYISGGLKIGGGAASVNGLVVNGCFDAPQGNKLKMNNNIDGNQYNFDNVNDIYADAYLPNSDKRLKKNIKTLTDSISVLEKLRPVSYEFKKKKGVRYGFIAQEFEGVLPELVKKDSKGMLTISYIDLIGIMVDAIQQLNSEIKNKIGAQ